MAERIAARLTPAEGRRFGLLVGAAFLALAGLAIVREAAAAPWLAAAGFALVLLGMVAPTLLRGVYRLWMGLGRLLSRVTVPVIMGLLFFLMITPIGVVRRLVGKNSIPARGAGRGEWLARDDEGTRSRMERQF